MKINYLANRLSMILAVNILGLSMTGAKAQSPGSGGEAEADAVAEKQPASAGAQVPTRGRRTDQDSSINNLIHPEGYETCTLGELGRVTKVGNGPVDMILVAGAGLGGG